jgi:hypothetical protein
VLRHKWFVFVAGQHTGASLWRLVKHDWTKFLPCEWLPYARTFYAPDGTKRYVENDAFTVAWNHHQKANDHHWQYWLITMDRGDTKPLEMPPEAVREMVADWMGAGRAITGRWECSAWYLENQTKIILHPTTREEVEWMLIHLPAGHA